MTAPRLSEFVKAYDVRGLVPEQLSPEVARALGTAFAEVVVLPEHQGNPPAGCVIGHDMRDSSPGLAVAFAEGLRERGVAVTMTSLVSTDALYYASGSLKQPGAMFTASHNPAAYNGIKLCRSGARPVGQDSGLVEVRNLAQRLLDGERIEPTASGPQIVHRDVLAGYAALLRELVDLRGIRPLRVVIDAGNGMAGHTAPRVLSDAAGLQPLPLEIMFTGFVVDPWKT